METDLNMDSVTSYIDSRLEYLQTDALLPSTAQQLLIARESATYDIIEYIYKKVIEPLAQ